jgi:hypothetical protein
LRTGVPADDHLRHQLGMIDGNPLQEIVMSALHHVKTTAWWSLADRDRHRLVQRYNTRLKSIYNPMPPQSARTLLAAMDSGQLRVIRAINAVTSRPGSGFEFTAASEAGETDVVINTCRTSQSRASGRAQPLLERLVASSHAAWHPLGGLRVDPVTGSLRRPSGDVHSGIRAIGEITSGEVYYATRGRSAPTNPRPSSRTTGGPRSRSGNPVRTGRSSAGGHTRCHRGSGRTCPARSCSPPRWPDEPGPGGHGPS